MPDTTLQEALDKLARLKQVARAVAWAQDHLPALLDAGGPSGVLSRVVDQASELTGAPNVWALTWTGRTRRSYQAFAGTADGAVPAPGDLSDSVIRTAVDGGVAVWSDDAQSDARFIGAESVQAFSLRSVGCVPIGERGVLYLQDPDAPGRFSVDHRYQLAALCRLAGVVLDRPPPERVERDFEPVPGLDGSSAAIAEVSEAIRAFAPMPWPVLILGETGVGKEIAARALHALSDRSEQPFVAVNCGAIPGELAESELFGHERGAFTGADRRREGRVERVRGGTLFLDEVGELEPRLQVKLLRLIQEGTYEKVGGDRTLPFRGRIIAATLRDVDDPESRGTFREDLYYRLAGCVIRIPPLRERAGDIPILARTLLRDLLGKLRTPHDLTLSSAAVRELQARSWPGNVRQLRNALQTSIAHAIRQGATTIEPDHLQLERAGAAEEPVSLDLDLQTATDQFQRRMVRAALDAEGGNRTAAAKRLDVSRQWLHRLLARWDDDG